MAAAKWVKTMEALKKVEDVVVDDERTKVVMASVTTLGMHELLELASYCSLYGVTYHVNPRILSTGLEVMIYKA